jgi:multicomponent Na+:H+ antiporter subunit D
VTGVQTCALPISEAAINGATAHAFAHILYKGLLFMGAGTVLYTTGRSKLTELGGLARAMPAVFLLYMVGAFSIAGFPLFSGFVSKSMVLYAAELSHMGVVILLLTLASVGTFLHTGLKLPYFTWFGPKRALAHTAAPKNMYVGMALIAAVNVAIGVYPALLYNLLPFPVDYRPYTMPHLLETVQLLTLTGLGFWLLVNKLGGEATITLDTDWLYRKPAALAYRLGVVALSRPFAAMENLSLYLAQHLVRLSADPAGYLALAPGFRILPRQHVGRQGAAPGDYARDQYELPLGGVVLLMLLCLVLVMWLLLVFL